VEASTGEFVPGNGNSYLLCRRRFDLVDMDHLRYKYLNAFDAAMHDVASRFKYLCGDHQYTSLKSDEDKMVVVERGDCVFVFNFHPVNSYTDYRIGLKHGGDWRLVLSSDNPEFGGYSNLWTCNCPAISSEEWEFNNRPASMMVYAPSRSVSVYAPVEAVRMNMGWA
jgi:1,4-alpha-glucan branching enzyme